MHKAQARSLQAFCFAALCLASSGTVAGACETAGIEAYPPEPAAQCAEAKVTLETGGVARCDGDLEKMATAGAEEYAAKGNVAAGEYAGPMGGFFKADADAGSAPGMCAVSCLKLPVGSAIVDARAATTVPASGNAVRQRIYATPREEAGTGEAAYISRIVMAHSTIGPLVCMAVGNWKNKAPDQEFMFYAYYAADEE